MPSNIKEVIAEVAFRCPGWQGMTMQLEDTANKVERMRYEVARRAGCSPDDVEVVLDDTRPVLVLRPRGQVAHYAAVQV